MPSRTFVKSEEFDNLILVATTFHILPSTIAQRLYGRDVPRSVTAMDWYQFDLAAAVKYHEMRELAELTDEEEREGPEDARLRHATIRAREAGALYDNGESLVIRGTEIPPWDPAYRASQ